LHLQPPRCLGIGARTASWPAETALVLVPWFTESRISLASDRSSSFAGATKTSCRCLCGTQPRSFHRVHGGSPAWNKCMLIEADPHRPTHLRRIHQPYNKPALRPPTRASPSLQDAYASLPQCNRRLRRLLCIHAPVRIGLSGPESVGCACLPGKRTAAIIRVLLAGTSRSRHRPLREHI
jgi:hypothetical protein